jgi:cytochrome c biogenesis protein CcmG, thiol:disulfide interchange protein DsbE
LRSAPAITRPAQAKAARAALWAGCLLGAAALVSLLLPTPDATPAAWEGRPLPDFLLPRLDDAARTVSPTQMLGQVWVLNIWASWCAPCRDEHALLVELAGEDPVPLVGLNHRDDARDAQEWLHRLGDPYAAAALDREGLLAARLDLKGVPASLVIDAQGRVRHVHRGPLTRAVWAAELLPLIRALRG